VYPFLVSSTTYHLSHDPDTDEYHEPQYTVFYSPNNSDGGKGFFVVAVDGACPGNGPSNGIAFNGIYFSPSPFNDHGHLPVGTPQTNQHAEIYAAIKAMKKVTESQESSLSRGSQAHCHDRFCLLGQFNQQTYLYVGQQWFSQLKGDTGW
jgi:hypothetical protein